MASRMSLIALSGDEIGHSMLKKRFFTLDVILGLKCILVYYPGHLAAGVHFDEEVAGDSFVLENESYVVCDPTYIGADVGMQMPDLNYDAAKLILLQ